ncbi:MAG TPA: hypothetical protein VKS21_13665 [Spirochaetota bacterium]|nr:hypothetical protein [Spirochaetota bacterium]
MKKNTTYREINPIRRSDAVKRGKSFLDICIFNFYNHFTDEGIESVCNVMEKTDLDYSISLIDIRGTFNDGAEVRSILKKFPYVRIFFSSRPDSFFDSLNLYFKESKANFILTVSADLLLTGFDIGAVIRKYYQDNSLFGVLPAVYQHDEIQNTFYKYISNRNNIFLSIEKFKSNMYNIVPYKFTGFFDKEKFLAVGGFDTSYKNDFITLLDLGYMIYSFNSNLIGVDNFSVKLSEYNQKTARIFENFNKDYFFDLKLFVIKNFVKVNRIIFTLVNIIKQLLIIRPGNILRIFVFCRKHSYIKNRIVRNEKQIEELFR